MLYDKKEIPDVFFLKHYNDDNDDNYIKYDDIILTNTLSPILFQNDVMNEYLLKLQPLVALQFDEINVFENFKNFAVDKYDYKTKPIRKR